MRELKFRAWDKEKKQMVNSIWVAPDGSWADSLVLGALKHSGKEDLMQYTGQKDKNGREIYEGNIVESKKKGINSYYGIGKVEWTGTAFYIPGIGTKFLEVVGNIYENADLLK